MRILVTGATGLIGKAICEDLRVNHEVHVVTRNRAKVGEHLDFPVEIIEGDLSLKPLEDQKLLGIEGVIHLAGENVGDHRWSNEVKARIFQSRVESTKNLIKSFGNVKPKIWIQASAVGYYGDRGDEILTEQSSKGQGFLSDVCEAWEGVLNNAVKAGDLGEVRACVLRTGMVFTHRGGALEKIRGLFRWHLGAPLGSGEQWMSWVHLQDLVRIYLWCLENSAARGVYNAVAGSCTNLEFSKALARQMDKNLGPSVPKLILKTLLGEMSELVLQSQRVAPQRLREQNFNFDYTTLEAALRCQL